MAWEILVDPTVIETLQFYEESIAKDLLHYLEQHLAGLTQPVRHADQQGEIKGITTFSRTTLIGVVMIFAQIDYERHQIKILHVQLRNNAADKC
ncbi:hypothetical protein [Candidatus Berkiella aquae]|uniref:Plasmid stabilization system protein n=1 Tax=Candidatus Berkiella aquae TaxID=295108 RepID=A0A0Q9YMG9_9GAMM|nr:hypothetical protein [Candidatus Berkiella aquae]MCS5709997.1 hypothetical protein [Candidatus Berkiella aquae]